MFCYALPVCATAPSLLTRRSHLPPPPPPPPPGGAIPRDVAARCWHAPSFFECDAVLVEEHPHRRRNHSHAVLGGQSLGDPSKRDVRRLLDQAKNKDLMRIKF